MPGLKVIKCISQERSATSQSELPRPWEHVDAAQARELLFEHVKILLLKVLGLPPGSSIDPRQGFRDMGLDSLMSVVIRGKLQQSIAKNLPMTLMFKCSNAQQLIDYLLKKIGTAPMSRDNEVAVRLEVSPDSGSAEDLEDLHGDELADLIEAELGSLAGLGI